MNAPYTIELHNHRFAAWAASTAASASPLCRFKVEKGISILEDIGFKASLRTPEQLPIPSLLDQVHREWRENAIQQAGKNNLNFSHGVAAKLINCYLKVRFVCAGHHNHDHVKGLHPPIDAILLKGLAKKNIGGFSSYWVHYHKARWSKYTSDQYEEVIDLIRRSIPDRPLWEIEREWQGHQ